MIINSCYTVLVGYSPSLFIIYYQATSLAILPLFGTLPVYMCITVGGLAYLCSSSQPCGPLCVVLYSGVIHSGRSNFGLTYVYSSLIKQSICIHICEGFDAKAVLFAIKLPTTCMCIHVVMQNKYLSPLFRHNVMNTRS